MKVNFKNLRKSELIRETIESRLKDDFERFPELRPDLVEVTVSMENSPYQAGPDVFGVKLRVVKGRYRGVILQKKSTSFYRALGKLNRGLVERLNRASGKARTLARKHRIRSVNKA
ncbi:MAG: hypothetical protein KDD39_12630 [Bdellovibrionales bacterium]|nr:hypothetical protein [Bdellovibrionales bacterium]